MLDPASRFRVPARVLLARRNGRDYLVDTEGGALYEMNQTAAAVVAGLREGAGLPALVGGLRERHPDMPESEIQRDVEELISRFLEEGLLEMEGSLRGPSSALPGP
jgi:hypothetical protein